jgi:non-canonical purine NTP pyrophosphatase (RdgB/HAM1 family)
MELDEPDLSTSGWIAAHKARDAFARLGCPVVVDDTAIFFDAYRNFPGPFPRRVFARLGFAGLLAKVKNRARGMRFETHMVYFDGEVSKHVKGIWKGTIAKQPARRKPHDRGGFPYERIFIPQGMSVPLSELAIGEKNRFSHRAKAARTLARWLHSR